MTLSKTVTWGHYKGERGYWDWHKGHLRFTPATSKARRSSDGLVVIKDIEPFVNIAVDNKIVSGRRQKRDMMRAHGVVECGDMPAKPQYNGPRYDAKAHQRSVVDSIKKSLHQHGLGD